MKPKKAYTVDSKRLEYGPGTINASVLSFLGVGVGSRVPTFWLVLWCKKMIHYKENIGSGFLGLPGLMSGVLAKA